VRRRRRPKGGSPANVSNWCGRGAKTRQRRRKGARDDDLAGMRQLVDRLRCEEGGRHGGGEL
jgi:hypothetical protein